MGRHRVARTPRVVRAPVLIAVAAVFACAGAESAGALGATRTPAELPIAAAAASGPLPAPPGTAAPRASRQTRARAAAAPSAAEARRALRRTLAAPASGGAAAGPTAGPAAAPGGSGPVVKTVSGNWALPNFGPYTSCYCERWGSFHRGIDLAGPLGSPIYAAGDGVVIDAGPASGFGNWVRIQHQNGDVTIYGHMRYFFVATGQRVTAGQQIAIVGAEGDVTGPHLHFGVEVGGPDGSYTDPVPWLAARGVSVGPYLPGG
ncbi:MAG: M23 family metallopeptidase [Actinomycetota bacterium]